MTAIDESLPVAQDRQPSLTVEGMPAESQQPQSDASQPIVPSSEHPETSPEISFVNGSDNPPEPPADPKVAALLAMFPTFDTSLLQSVLESVAGDQDRAVDVLLGMSDPSYTSNERAVVTQTELDEEIARRLMLEESEQQAAWQPNRTYGNVPYRPRTGPTLPNDRQRSTEGDGVTQFQEQLGRFAETGKKTFNTFLSKVRAKMQEFDTPSGQSQVTSSPQPLPGGDSWSTPMHSQSYNGTNPPPLVQGYDLGIPAASVNQPVTTVQPSASSNPEIVSSPPASGISAPGSVDPSKLGLLPKRPVSLGSSAKPSGNIVEDDEVEYVENPFEESAHR